MTNVQSQVGDLTEFTQPATSRALKRLEIKVLSPDTWDQGE